MQLTITWKTLLLGKIYLGICRRGKIVGVHDGRTAINGIMEMAKFIKE